jgi:hypothetical protein
VAGGVEDVGMFTDHQIARPIAITNRAAMHQPNSLDLFGVFAIVFFFLLFYPFFNAHAFPETV